MEFTPFQGGWQLSRRTAEMLLALGNSADGVDPARQPAPPPQARHLPRIHPAPAPPPSQAPSADPSGLMRMWIGWLEFDVLLGDVRSLKQKRSVIRPVVAELQRKFSVSAAETGSQDLYRRAGIGVAVVSGDRGHAVDVLDAAERLVAAHPEFELLSVRRSLHRSDD